MASMERRVEALGPTGERVSARLAAIRRFRRLTLGELAAKLGDLGRPIQLSALSKIEKGQRRVDADDLVALALALDVSTNTLLLPEQSDPTGAAQLTLSKTLTTREAWKWANQDQRLASSAYKGNSIFISYASSDGGAWANWIAFVLERSGYRVRLDSWDLAPGDNIKAYLEEAISTAAGILVIMTKSYVSSSWFPMSEFHDKPILPVRVDGSTPKGVLASIVALDLTSENEPDAAAEALVSALVSIGISPRKIQKDAPWPLLANS